MRWVDKYRPTTLDSYIVPASAATELNYVLKGSDNLVMYGPAGTGKTTFARLYGGHLGTTEYGDFVELHAGKLQGVQEVRDTVEQLVLRQGGWEGDRLVIHLEECDNLTRQAQIALKPLMENYPQTTFIITTNNIKDFEPAILSRCVVAHLTLTEEDIVNVYKMFTRILNAEGIIFCKEELMELAKRGFSDLRIAIRELEMRYK